MRRNKFQILALAVVLAFVFCSFVTPFKSLAAGEEETIAGTVSKSEKGIVIEAEDGDYLVKGKDLSSMTGKMVEATGIISETEKGDVIDVKSFEEIQE